jgi:hypothetical protein
MSISGMTITTHGGGGEKLTGSVERLATGPHPANGARCMALFKGMLQANEADHLLHHLFNQPTELGGHDPLSKLLALQEAKAAAKADTTKTSEKKEESKPTVKLEPGVAQSASSGGVYAAREFADVIDVKDTATQHFLDPMLTLEQDKDVVENRAAQRLRYKVWSYAMEMLLHHPDLIAGGCAGDIVSLYERMQTFVGKNDIDTILDSYRALITISKSQTTPWLDVLGVITAARLALAQTTDPEFQVPDRLQKLFLFRAMAGDARYSTPMAFLQKEHGLTMPTLLLRITKEARQIEAPAASTPLTGMVAQVKSKGVCYSYRDHGKCKFGDGCKFIHGEASGDEVSRSGSTRSRSKSKAKVTPDSTEGRGCYECGSTSHGVANCEQYKQRKKASAGQAAPAMAGYHGALAPSTPGTQFMPMPLPPTAPHMPFVPPMQQRQLPQAAPYGYSPPLQSPQQVPRYAPPPGFAPGFAPTPQFFQPSQAPLPVIQEYNGPAEDGL